MNKSESVRAQRTNECVTACVTRGVGDTVTVTLTPQTAHRPCTSTQACACQVQHEIYRPSFREFPMFWTLLSGIDFAESHMGEVVYQKRSGSPIRGSPRGGSSLGSHPVPRSQRSVGFQEGYGLGSHLSSSGHAPCGGRVLNGSSLWVLSDLPPAAEYITVRRKACLDANGVSP